MTQWNCPRAPLGKSPLASRSPCEGLEGMGVSQGLPGGRGTLWHPLAPHLSVSLSLPCVYFTYRCFCKRSTQTEGFEAKTFGNRRKYQPPCSLGTNCIGFSLEFRCPIRVVTVGGAEGSARSMTGRMTLGEWPQPLFLTSMFRYK